MRAILVIFCSAVTILINAQPAPPPVYKSVSDNYFSKGDRIWMNEAVVVQGSKQFTITFSDSMEVYRKFVQANPNMTFRLNFYWKQEGVKYPGRSESVKDSLMQFFNKPVKDKNDTCMQVLYSFKHHVKKQKVLLLLELEILNVQVINGYNHPVTGVVALSESHTIFRNHDNPVAFSMNSFADSMWVRCEGCVYTPMGKNNGIIRVSTTGRTATIAVASLFGVDTTWSEPQVFRVTNLPEPVVFLGSNEMSSISTMTESDFRQVQAIIVRYPMGNPMNTCFEVEWSGIRIGNKTIVNKGNYLGEEYRQAYEEAEEGTLITFESVKVHLKSGGYSNVISTPFTYIKKSPIGTKIVEPEKESIIDCH